MKKIITGIAAASLLGAVAQAEDAPPAPAVATNISLTTNYKFRGQDQGTEAAAFKPALQGGFDYSNSGFYVGNWNSSIGWIHGADTSSIEMDFYGGYKGEITPEFTYDVGVLEYAYPGASFANTTEIYGALSYGIASLKYSRTVSSKYFGFVDGKGTGYFDLSANYEIVKGLTLNGHVGFTQFSGDSKTATPGLVDYTDYKLGATYDLGSGFAVAGAIVGANKKDAFLDLNNGVSLNKSRFIVSISKSM